MQSALDVVVMALVFVPNAFQDMFGKVQLVQNVPIPIAMNVVLPT